MTNHPTRDPNTDARARERLTRLVRSLSEDQLRTPMPDGWTVAAVLAHLAFWDYRTRFVVQRLRSEGIVRPVPDDEAVNAGAKPQWLAVPPHTAAEQVLEAADVADSALDAAGADLLRRLELAGEDTQMANHRLAHVEEIERALGL